MGDHGQSPANWGTSDCELDKMAKDLGIKNYKGCFMSDQLKFRIPEECECGIINSSDSTTDGKHWFCWYKNGDTKIFFDSFGTNPPEELIEYLGHGIKSSTFQLQNINSDICGELSLLILYLLDRGHNYEDIILDIVYKL